MFKHMTLDADYTFSSISSNSGNRFGIAAAKIIVSDPGTAYNPLLIFGSVESDRTLLLNAIVNEFNQSDSNKTSLYLSADNSQVSEIENNLQSFMPLLRSVDMLLIQNTENINDPAQPSFIDVLEFRISNNKQVVLSSHKRPEELFIWQKVKSMTNFCLSVDLL